MQPLTPYRPERYPPRGAQWPQFGESALGQSLSVTDEARHHLTEKRQEMLPIHQDRLQHHGLAPMNMPTAEHFSMDQEAPAEAAEAADEQMPPAQRLSYARGVAASEPSETSKKTLAYQRDVAASEAPAKKQLSYQRGVAANILSAQTAEAHTQASEPSSMEEDTLTVAYDDPDETRTIDYDDEEMPEEKQQKRKMKPAVFLPSDEPSTRRMRPSPKIKTEASRIAAVDVPVPDDDEVQISSLSINRNTDMNFWEQQSANEIRAQLNLRNRNQIGNWAFKNKKQLEDLVSGMIRAGTW